MCVLLSQRRFYFVQDRVQVTGDDEDGVIVPEAAIHSGAGGLGSPVRFFFGVQLLHSPGGTDRLYMLKDKRFWDLVEETKYHLKRGRLPAELQNVPVRKMEEIRV